jgi:hypothetical protein
LGIFILLGFKIHLKNKIIPISYMVSGLEGFVKLALFNKKDRGDSMGITAGRAPGLNRLEKERAIPP